MSRSGGTTTLFPVVYEALHSLARRRMAREAAAHTLQPTALVNEVYVRLSGESSVRWESQGHFFAAAAEAMRRILIEHARHRCAAKRGYGQRPVQLEGSLAVPNVDHGLTDEELIELHRALDALEQESPRLALLVKLKYFVGMTAGEIADSLEVSVPTVHRQWGFARTWLHTWMVGGDAGPPA